MRLDLFVKLKYQSSPVILSGSKYSVQDLFCDVSTQYLCLTYKVGIGLR